MYIPAAVLNTNNKKTKFLCTGLYNSGKSSLKYRIDRKDVD
jgi:hypothetical protein